MLNSINLSRLLLYSCDPSFPVRNVFTYHFWAPFLWQLVKIVRFPIHMSFDLSPVTNIEGDLTFGIFWIWKKERAIAWRVDLKKKWIIEVVLTRCTALLYYYLCGTKTALEMWTSVRMASALSLEKIFYLRTKSE